jgi:bacterioferritin (cytochrome b1)
MFTAKCTQCGKRYWFHQAAKQAKMCAKEDILAGPLGMLNNEINYEQERIFRLTQLILINKDDDILLAEFNKMIAKSEEKITELTQKRTEVEKLRG